MEQKYFSACLSAYQSFMQDISELHRDGFDFFEGKYKLTHPIDLLLENTFKSHYGDQGWEWIEWFIYESEYGTNPDINAYDENKTPICYSDLSLWEYLEKHHSNNK